MIFEKQVLNMYKGMMHARCDDTETVFYFGASDFPGLLAEPFSFAASAGHTLQGYVYSYENAGEGRLVVFDHGFGGGHRAYMKEIERLCRAGYAVLAYDHTGCMESGGDSPNGLAQSLCDLNDCLCAIKKSERFSGRSISVVGHSWGAFSALNIAALHPGITHTVAMCGFVSVEEMIATFFSGIMKGYRKAVLALEQASNPVFSGYNAVRSLKNTKTKALLIYSDNDALCKKRHYDILCKALEGEENVRFLLVKNKGHNPNYTEEALAQLAAFGKARARLLRKKHLTLEEKQAFVASFNFDKMTEQDESVWSEILSHLAS